MRKTRKMSILVGKWNFNKLSFVQQALITNIIVEKIRANTMKIMPNFLLELSAGVLFLPCIVDNFFSCFNDKIQAIQLIINIDSIN